MTDDESKKIITELVTSFHEVVYTTFKLNGHDIDKTNPGTLCDIYSNVACNFIAQSLLFVIYSIGEMPIEFKKMLLKEFMKCFREAMGEIEKNTFEKLELMEKVCSDENHSCAKHRRTK